MAYTRVDSDGKTFEFTGDVETLAGWSLHGQGTAHSDGFQLVARRALASWEGIAFGRGQSENPDEAEAYLYFDARSDDADADGTPDVLTGQYEIVVLNGANEKLATVDRGRLEEVRSGDPKRLGGSDKRGEYGVPFKYKTLRKGRGEIMGDDYQIGLRLNLDSGNDALNLSNSDLLAEGYSGRKVN
jgi:hypothetical protein